RKNDGASFADTCALEDGRIEHVADELHIRQRLALDDTHFFAGILEQLMHLSPDLTESGDEKRTALPQVIAADDFARAFQRRFISDKLEDRAGLNARGARALRI